MRRSERLKTISFWLNVSTLLFAAAAFIAGEMESFRFCKSFSCVLCGVYFGAIAYEKRQQSCL